MADAPLDVIIAAYNDQEGAKKALGELKAAQKDKVIAIKDAAVIWKDKDSKLHVSETGDMTGTRGAAYGGVAGAVLTRRMVAGLLFGVTPTEPALLAGVGIILMLTSAAAAVIPARRATRIDPATALLDR